MAASNETLFEEKFKSLLTCPICYEIYKEPRSLPCLHTYCAKCLEEFFTKAKSLTCPECRMELPLYINEMDELPSAFLIKSFIELYKKLKEPEERKRLEELERVRLIQVKRNEEIEERMMRNERRRVKDALKSENPDWRARESEVDTDWEGGGRPKLESHQRSDSVNWRADSYEYQRSISPSAYRTGGGWWRQH
ncbi:hypothetical protein EMCRGX_G019022 [Ephydatia muelleri]